MLKTLEGTFRNGQVQFTEPVPTEVEGARVMVTFLPKNGPIDLRAVGISEEQAADLRQRLSTFIEDWDDPAMDVYNDL